MLSSSPWRSWLVLAPALLGLSCHPDRPTQTEAAALVAAPVADSLPTARPRLTYLAPG